MHDNPVVNDRGESLILEGIVTTVGRDGTLNIAPMGPIVDRTVSTITLRPFETSTTYRNLRDSRAGVLHVVDNVEWIAQGAIGRWDSVPETQAARCIAGRVLVDCCRWWEFDVVEIDDSSQRIRIDTRIVHSESNRDFFGFNRAMHAVLEAAILATRLHILERQTVVEQLANLQTIVDKTAGDREHRAFHLIRNHVENWHAAST